MSRLRFLFVPLDAHLLADWHRVGIGDTLTSVLHGQAGDPSNCHLCQLVPADIGLHPLLPFLEERAVLRKGQALALLLLPHALRLALDPIQPGLAELGKNLTGYAVDEGIRLRLITPERQFVEGRFVDDLLLLHTSAPITRRRGVETHHPFPIIWNIG